MFYNNPFVTFFSNKHVKFLSVKQLYKLYTIFNKVYNLSTTKNRLLWYSYIYIIVSNFNFNFKCLFLLMLYFLKTNKISFFKKIRLFKISWLKWDTILAKYVWAIKAYPSKYTLYWIMWAMRQKVPSTRLDFRIAYMQEYERRLRIYAKLGLITLHEKCYVFQIKLIKLKDIVKINKPLVLSPKYSSSTVHKYLNNHNLDNFEFQFLRKNKVYNKGRYSRTRQNYRTGVYLCMYFSVVSLFGLYYWFYRFSFNFTYLWWFFISFVASFFFPKIVKYRLYEPSTLLSKFYDFFKWVSLVLKSLFF